MNRLRKKNRAAPHSSLDLLLIAALVLVHGCAHAAVGDGSVAPPAPETAAESAAIAASEEPGTAQEPAAQPANPVPSDPQALMLRRAQAFFDAGDYRNALLLCVDLAYFEPDYPGLETLRTQTVEQLQNLRMRQLENRQGSTRRGLITDATAKWNIPDTYGLSRFVEGAGPDDLVEQNPLLKVLQQPVTLQLKGATLGGLIEVLSKDPQINIITDKAVATQGALDIEVEQVPLQEVLDFAARNLNVQFHLGRNMIWITAADPKKAPEMETRIFRLNKGIPLRGSDWGLDGKRPDAVSILSSKSTLVPSELSALETLLSKFVPKPTGAEFYLDRDMHVLFAKNTPQNLLLTEEIVRAVDRNPPQVLIEARFVETTISDLSELGFKWEALQDIKIGGGTVEAGKIVDFDWYQNTVDIINPLAPVGAFSFDKTAQTRPTADQMNLSLKGTLNGNELKAVLHALEISGKGEMLSVPRVTTINNNPAKLRSGSDFYYYKQFKAQAFTLLDANNKAYNASALMPDGEPTLEELGITLVAVPSVGADMKTINLLLMPTISEFKGFESYFAGAGAAAVQQVEVKLPKFSRQEIQTKVVVESGQTVAMGGLINKVRQTTEHRVPLLGDIPLLGRLFRQKSNTEEVRNLIIFVTATVISERGESLLPLRPDSLLMQRPEPAAFVPVNPAAAEVTEGGS